MKNFETALETAQNNTKPRESTKELYRKRWKYFSEWCEAEGRECYSPTTETIGAYLREYEATKMSIPKKAGKFKFFTYSLAEGQAALSGPKKERSAGRKSEFQPLLKHIKELTPGNSMLLHNIPANQVQSLRVFLLGQWNKEKGVHEGSKVDNPLNFEIRGRNTGEASGKKKKDGTAIPAVNILISYHEKPQSRRTRSTKAEATK